jgi:hypothetical protein
VGLIPGTANFQLRARFKLFKESGCAPFGVRIGQSRAKLIVVAANPAGVARIAESSVQRFGKSRIADLAARFALPLLAANMKAADKRKGHLGRRTHCAQGHSLLDPANVKIVIEPAGWRRRMCLACRYRIENSGGEMKAEQVEAVTAAINAGATVNEISHGIKGGRPRDKKLYIVSFRVLKRYRSENPEFDSFVRSTFKANQSRASLLARSMKRARQATAERREQANDYYTIRSMIPSRIADPDEIVGRIFEDMLSGALDRADVANRVSFYIQEREKLFPTKYRKFGDGLLVSLDEQIFDDGGATRGDMVTHGLWD